MEKMYFCVDVFNRKVTIIYWMNKKQRKLRITKEKKRKKNNSQTQIHDYEYACINLDIWHLGTVHCYDVDASNIQVSLI